MARFDRGEFHKYVRAVAQGALDPEVDLDESMHAIAADRIIDFADELYVRAELRADEVDRACGASFPTASSAAAVAPVASKAP